MCYTDQRNLHEELREGKSKYFVMIPDCKVAVYHFRQNLESRVQILERQKVESDERAHADQLRHEQQIREVQLSKEQVEKEMVTLRSVTQNQALPSCPHTYTQLPFCL